MKVYFMRAQPGAGMSMVARRMLAENPNMVRCNMDDIRSTLGQPFSKESEHLALKIQDSIVLTALREGRDVVVDNCHLHPTWPKRLATLIWEAGLPVSYEIVDVVADQDTALARNQYRRESPQFEDSMAVPDDVIRKMSKQIDSKRRNGDLWTIEDLTAGLPEIAPYPNCDDLPSCCISDLDGTLAMHVGRDPYDTAKCYGDELNADLASILDNYPRGGDVIMMSGRSEDYRDITEAWLRDCGIKFDHLFMRASGDERRDSIVKLELFNQHIRDKYIVDAIYDDRKRVCDVWYQLGLPLFRVGDPSADF